MAGNELPLCDASISLNDISYYLKSRKYAVARFQSHSGSYYPINFIQNNVHPTAENSPRGTRWSAPVGWWAEVSYAYDISQGTIVPAHFESGRTGIRLNLLNSLCSAFVFIMNSNGTPPATQKEMVKYIQNLFPTEPADEAIGKAAAAYVLLTRPDLSFTGNDFFGGAFSYWAKTFSIPYSYQALTSLPDYALEKYGSGPSILPLLIGMQSAMKSTGSIGALASSFNNKQRYFSIAPTPQIDAVATVVCLLASGFGGVELPKTKTINIQPKADCAVVKIKGRPDVYIPSYSVDQIKNVCKYDNRSYYPLKSREQAVIDSIKPGLSLTDSDVICRAKITLKDIANNLYTVIAPFSNERRNMYYPINFLPFSDDWIYENYAKNEGFDYDSLVADIEREHSPQLNLSRPRAAELAKIAQAFVDSPKVNAGLMVLSPDFTAAGVLRGLDFIAQKIMSAAGSMAVKKAKIAQAMLLDTNNKDVNNYLYPSSSAVSTDMSPVFPEEAIGLSAAAYALLYSDKAFRDFSSDATARIASGYAPNVLPAASAFLKDRMKDGSWDKGLTELTQGVVATGFKSYTSLALSSVTVLLVPPYPSIGDLPELVIRTTDGVSAFQDGTDLLKAVCQFDSRNYDTCKSREQVVVDYIEQQQAITDDDLSQDGQSSEDKNSETGTGTSTPPPAALTSESGAGKLLLALGVGAVLFYVLRKKKEKR